MHLKLMSQYVCHAVCVDGDRVAGDVDADAWSDDDVIGAAAMRGPAWEGGAAGDLRGAFSGGRHITGTARDVVSPPPEAAQREPDGNAAPGTTHCLPSSTACILAEGSPPSPPPFFLQLCIFFNRARNTCT